MSRIAERLAALRWAFPAYVAILPFAHTVALRNLLLLLASGAALGTLLAPERRRSASGLPAAAVFLLAWAAWAALSVSWSIRPEFSARQLLSELLPGLLAFFAGHVLITTRDAWRALHLALAFAVLVFAGFGLAALWLPGLGTAYRIGDTGYASTVLALGLPAFLVPLAARDTPPAARLLLAALLPPLCIAAYATHNRMLWPVIALTALGALLLARGSTPRARWLVWGGLLGGGGLCAALLVAISIERGVLDGTQSPAVLLGQLLLTDARWPIWQATPGLIGEAPWLGHGYGRTIAEAPLLAAFGPLIAHTHNLVLNQWLSLGAIGASLFLLTLAAGVRPLWRLARGDDPLCAQAGATALLVLTAFVAKNLTDDFLAEHTGQLFWALFGAGLGLARHAGDRFGHRRGGF